MGSLTASTEAMGGGVLDLLTIMAGVDGLVGAMFGSIGDLIGVGGGAA
ncbi:hypothetical protein G6016_14150 [Dietzia aerolata]|uniref:Uncharacterized protein n=1 Tax=Dietzia aerolata TaxID=595984 RepID=A0ABV5JSG3_9ACTN|nr:hypothetical protein [Dietzia aerolata]MBB0970075.1 hypothetical protein [Dietzia aerolata]